MQSLQLSPKMWRQYYDAFDLKQLDKDFLNNIRVVLCLLYMVDNHLHFRNGEGCAIKHGFQVHKRFSKQYMLV